MSNQSSLPDDMFFEILVHLSAKDIYDATRLVCCKWYNMIHTNNFIQTHLQHAPFGLLFHSCHMDSRYMTLRQGRVEISKLTRFKFSRESWSSCNGLILEFHFPTTFYVVNPITNQVFVLPPFIHSLSTGRFFVMAYVAASMEYKVVAAFGPNIRTGDTFLHCHILTVGVDNSWRTIRTQQMTLADIQTIKLSRPVMTQGFIHWIGDGDIFTLNVETETINRIRRPKPFDRRPISISRSSSLCYGNIVTYLSTGGRLLSCLVPCGEFLWEVWENNPDSREWKKLFDIDLEHDEWTLERPRRNEFREYGYLVPIGWVKYLELLAFRPSRNANFVFFYSCVGFGIFGKFDLHNPLCRYNVFLHQNSLVWLDGS
ncbi:hypothetical protein CASFOL_019602 [Castilleja foliolosa]|uniref:F-box domain-containing protein n=1 Tax=Castilleja foliolosa TaxID=1961234 RepID=A0ABD3D4T5_9LAMI